ncbi:tRNA preQ1(34) S-adenosylmethionine ribosyltransferase-isomerase QueA [Prosthecomicrobium hirschii]|uniref:tRNA preQ1(34) S-adenosylmethionine ribosyltransferase-isomerase QueA n=1 Tax=Prosthecodimorpha hirschii TaxID=665126 RepID=UPI00112B90B7|nr:tRNA preQ1(34) S-adenosylmethionine ribosyltransferase-isomerase QueA [Prosthecomicrobium hirschii]TPQ49864.1 tRNA preQ1(34) S-adenosylmethionine ribosyltransferase-isomerase QueA [Prosthecomicrobium hirschii]
MRVDLFDFDLPAERIALRPASPREAARLMVVRPDEGCRIEDRTVGDLPELVRPGDALVFNDTRVIPAELHGTRIRDDGRVAVAFTLLKREGADRWRAFARPGKRLKVGDRVLFGEAGRACLLGEVWATVVEKAEDGQVLVAFDLAGPDLDQAIHAVGTVPLPPYISSKRAADAQDLADYQTVYARAEGAVAAPTAGLHFTPDLITRLDAAGVERHFVTLHVGAGTFLPVKVEDTAEHRMHSEWGTIDAATADALNAVRARGGRIVAVGTTSLRLLESAADGEGRIRPFSGETDIFITPGKPIRAVDMLMTNFHLPRSTLFMLVSAFAGLDCMRAAYAQAIATGYRFYSYGDTSLLFRATGR